MRSGQRMIEQVRIEASVLLSFIGPELAGERWKQWRVYFTDILPTGGGTQRLPRMELADAANAGYPKVYNVEMDPHEDLNVAGLFAWVMDPALEGRARVRTFAQGASRSARTQHHALWTRRVSTWRSERPS